MCYFCFVITCRHLFNRCWNLILHKANIQTGPRHIYRSFQHAGCDGILRSPVLRIILVTPSSWCFMMNRCSVFQTKHRLVLRFSGLEMKILKNSVNFLFVTRILAFRLFCKIIYSQIQEVSQKLEVNFLMSESESSS